jgi:hypothetical protein
MHFDFACLCRVVALLFHYSGLDRGSAGLLLLLRCQGVGDGLTGYVQGFSHHFTRLSLLDRSYRGCERRSAPSPLDSILASKSIISIIQLPLSDVPGEICGPIRWDQLLQICILFCLQMHLPF